MKRQVVKISLLQFFRQVIILSLVLSVLVKPISTILLQPLGVKYELFDDFENNESTEKENNKEHDELSNYYSSFIITILNTDYINNYFTAKKNITDFELEVQLPPPKF